MHFSSILKVYSNILIIQALLQSFLKLKHFLKEEYFPEFGALLLQIFCIGPDNDLSKMAINIIGIRYRYRSMSQIGHPYIDTLLDRYTVNELSRHDEVLEMQTALVLLVQLIRFIHLFLN